MVVNFNKTTYINCNWKVSNFFLVKTFVWHRPKSEWKHLLVKDHTAYIYTSYFWFGIREIVGTQKYVIWNNWRILKLRFIFNLFINVSVAYLCLG